MRHQHIGQIDAPVLLFGGPYSNSQALRALFAEAEKRAIAPSHMICTGDIVAYCADPVECVEMIRHAAIPTISGNCEAQLAVSALDCGCGFETGTVCDLLSAGWFAHANTQVNADARAWMGALPDVITFDHFGARYGVLHGGATDVARFIWSTSPDTAFDEEWAAVEAIAGPVDHIIAGHSGIAFVKDTGHGRWINAGVIGMPPHDGHRDTQFALLEAGAVNVHRLTYDAETAAARMHEVGLTQGYARGLTTGIWPSEDVLPQDLRRDAGLAKG